MALLFLCGFCFALLIGVLINHLCLFYHTLCVFTWVYIRVHIVDKFLYVCSNLINCVLFKRTACDIAVQGELWTTNCLCHELSL